MGAAYQKFQASTPLRNQCDEQCSNKSAERRAPARGKAHIAQSDALEQKSFPNLAGELPKL